MTKAKRWMIGASYVLFGAVSVVGCDGGSESKTEVSKPAMTQEDQKAEAAKREQATKDSMTKGKK